MRYLLFGILFALLPLTGLAEKVDSVIEVAPVWSGHPVGFALLTRGANQYVAFYDTNRQMTLAWRPLPSSTWRFKRLPSWLGWDSHNYVTLALDAANCLHVSGNMHVVPLVYFRGSKPFDIDSVQPFPAMVGNRELKVTYPQFLNDSGGNLVFTYRDGQSGNGDQILNVYRPAQRQWQRLLDTPLFTGHGRMNAYYHGPELGPDHMYHVSWVWRDSGDCSSNHDLSYARSRDLVHWESSQGKPLVTPISLETGEIVDPTPVKGGLLNTNHRIGFDSQGRCIISYHKYDAKGFLQAYCARLENGRWKQYQVSDWQYRWEFSGGGSIIGEVSIGAVTLTPDHKLTLSYAHIKHGNGAWILDEATLKPTGQFKQTNPFAEYDQKFAIKFPGLQTRRASDLGGSGEPGVTYQLRWQTLPANRDRPQTVPLPPPIMLRLYRLTSP